MVMMNVEIISQEKIAPSSPTPHDHRIYELSFLDQLAPTYYFPIILFYKSEDNHNINQVEISCRLKKSLEETLTLFSPLAGRVIEDPFVECNDEGVDYYEARVTCKLSEVLKHFSLEILSQFLPFAPFGNDTKAGSPKALLAIQYNNFDCGGVAIGVSFSHRIVDGAAAATFLNAWSATSRGDVLEAVCPKINWDMCFPPKDISWGKWDMFTTKDKLVARRLLFDESSIANLRDKAFSTAGFEGKLTTRVEAVSAFLWKRLLMISKSKQAMPRLCVATQAVNLRQRTVPPMPMNSFGNLWTLTPAILSPHELDQNGDGILVNKLRNAINAINSDYTANLKGDVIPDSLTKIMELAAKGDLESCVFTGWCRFPLYEADFGWGKPTWFCCPIMPAKNMVILTSTRDERGIEAIFNLLEEDAIIFDSDPELLPYVAWTIAG